MTYFKVLANELETRVGPANLSQWWIKHFGEITHTCYECCTSDRCDENCFAKYKRKDKNCPHCKGSGHIRVSNIKYCILDKIHND